MSEDERATPGDGEAVEPQEGEESAHGWLDGSSLARELLGDGGGDPADTGHPATSDPPPLPPWLDFTTRPEPDDEPASEDGEGGSDEEGDEPGHGEEGDEQPEVSFRLAQHEVAAATEPAVQERPPAEERSFSDRQTATRDGTTKLGIVGGKGVGKSYLFQAMVYRTYSGNRSGALTYYLERDGTELLSSHERDGDFTPRNLQEFVDNYEAWRRLGQTYLDQQLWYRLRLNFRTGMLGRRRESLDVEFFDASGEGFFERAFAKENRRLWHGYADAEVMVFCLPLWIAFPGPALSDEDQEHRARTLAGFERVVDHYRNLRRVGGHTRPVRSILGLTMADDRRGALDRLRSRWITPYMDRPGPVLRRLRTGAGVARYLDNARRVSEALHREFFDARQPAVSRIPSVLDFDGGKPWIVPLSAIEGSRLDVVEARPTAPPPAEAPVPVHVELPLLVALCERTNALM